MIIFMIIVLILENVIIWVFMITLSHDRNPQLYQHHPLLINAIVPVMHAGSDLNSEMKIIIILPLILIIIIIIITILFLVVENMVEICPR